MKPLDLIVTPLAFFLIMALAYLLRKTTASNETKRYFYPALLLKIVGALGVGFIYQFYYGGVILLPFLPMVPLMFSMPL